MMNNEDLLKDSPESGYEDYTENFEKEEKKCGCTCGRKNSILIGKEKIE